MWGMKCHRMQVCAPSKRHIRALQSFLTFCRDSNIGTPASCGVRRKTCCAASHPSCKSVPRIQTHEFQHRIGYHSLRSVPSTLPSFFHNTSSFSFSTDAATTDEKATDAIKQLEVSYENLLYIVTESPSLTLSSVWLRENCPCADCYYAATSQRKVLFHQLRSEALSINQTYLSADKQSLNVKWEDGHLSLYDVAWLKQNWHAVLYSQAPVLRTLWNSREITDSELCRVKFDQLVNRKSEETRRALLSGLLKFGFAFVDETPATAEATIEVASQISAPLRTLYGETWTFEDLGEKLTFADTAYTSEALGAHTDGTYYRNPPGIQILHCLSHEGGTGGESLLVDGFRAAEDLRTRDPEAFRVLTQHTFDHQYIDENNVLHSCTTVLKDDPGSGGLEWIRYNPYDRSPLVPFSVCHSTLGAAYRALAHLARLLDSPENQYWTKLRPGTVMLMDNWRVLHGRAAYSGRRVMTGCYLGRDEWLSMARLSGAL